MMITLRQLEFSEALKAYLGECLKDGNTLSRRVSEKINLEEGKVYAALPQDFDLSRLPCYEHGGIAVQKMINPRLFKVENEDYLQYLVAEIKDYLLGGGKIVIFEDSLMGPDAPFIHANKGQLSIVANDQELYYCLTSEDTTEDDKILRTIKQASGLNSMVYVGFFVCIDRITDLRKELELLSDKISAIVFGAFDRESFLFWKPNEWSDLRKSTQLKS